MVKLKFRYNDVMEFIEKDQIRLFDSEFSLHHKNLYSGKGKGSDFTGWVDLPSKTGNDLLSRIEEDARKIAEQSQVVVVTGIGGSYLGARAVIEALSGPFDGLLEQPEKKSPLVLYAGHHMDEDYQFHLIQLLDQKDYSVIVISKSGTTTEPAIAFRLLKSHLEGKYGDEEASSRVYAITDASKGALKKLADEKNYATYVIPDDVGGRYSVLTPVGLLPIAAAGISIRKLIEGAQNMEKFLKEKSELSENPAGLYAVLRNILYQKGKTIEILAGYNPSLHYFIEWWKQLYGESEGKEGKGIFPAGVGFTTDLHSMGQYIQDGLRNLFETVINIEAPRNKVEVPHDPDNLDGLNYLKEKRISYVNAMASKATMLAHVDGGVPNMEIVLPEINEETLGEMVYFFEMGCALSGYILDVNPFDQPGVEAYKKNMFALLEKPGFEKESEAIKKRLR